jgi:uroporphyrin-III C-methyltransferase
MTDTVTTDTAATGPSPAPVSRSWLVPAVAAGAALMMLVLLLAGAALWWQYRELQTGLRAFELDGAVAQERGTATARALEERLAALDASAAETRRAVESLANRLNALPDRLAGLEQRIDAMPDRLAGLEQRVDAMQGGSVDARSHWLRLEAEHYLMVANTELELAGHWNNAIRALEIADDRLRQLADPSLGAVRARIASELLALRAVEQPDVDGIVRALGGLADTVDDLPLRAGLPSELPQAGAEPEDAEAGLSRLWGSVRRAAQGIVSIERRDTPVERALSAEERVLVRRQLGLALEFARLAAARQQPQAFNDGLRSARTLLEREFERDAAAVRGALELLDRLGALTLAPQRPDISESLALLRRLGAGER